MQKDHEGQTTETNTFPQYGSHEEYRVKLVPFARIDRDKSGRFKSHFAEQGLPCSAK
jgi:hypothetical protein